MDLSRSARIVQKCPHISSGRHRALTGSNSYKASLISLGKIPNINVYNSALFVVDLNRLRATLTGDLLRAQYQMLSQDPHSLSNLDQDLPNSIQSRVPIVELPGEWLWCKTWCSDKTKSKAKVIDLVRRKE
jgi:hypothetical protein